MKSYLGLIPRYLKKQSKRTMMTVCGLILSVMLIASVGIISDSAEISELERIKRDNGSQHGIFYGIDSKQLSVLKGDTRIEKLGIMEALGSFILPGNNTQVDIGFWDQNLKDNLKLTLVSGRMPEKENEIVLEESVLGQMKLGSEIGQKIPLTYIKRIKDEKGEEHGIDTTSEFILAGTYKNLAGLGSGITRSFAIVSEKTLLDKGSNGLDQFTAFVEIEKGLHATNTINEIIRNQNIDIKNVGYNRGLLDKLGEGRRNEGANWIRIIIIVLVIASTMAGIYNSIHISVLERIKQFGVMKSIGTTPAQIRRIVLGESLLMSLISIPSGLVLGIAVSYTLALFLRNVFDNINHIVVSPGIILISSGISFLTLLLSSFNPVRLAGKVSPIEAMLGRGKVLKESKLRHKGWHAAIQKLAGITGRMAYQNIWRNRKRCFITAFSMCIGVVMYIVFSYYASIADKLMGNPGTSDFIVGTHMIDNKGGIGYSQQDFDEIASIPGVKKVDKLQTAFGFVLFPSDRVTQQIRKASAENKLRAEDLPAGFVPLACETFGYDQEMIKETERFLVDGEIAPVMESGQLSAIYVAPLTDKDDPNRLKAGDEVTLRLFEQPKAGAGSGVGGGKAGQSEKPAFKNIKIKIAGVVTNAPSKQFSNSGPTFILHKDSYKQLFKSDLYQKFEITVEDNVDKENIDRSLDRISQRIRSGYMENCEEVVKKERELIKQVVMIYFGLIAVIGIIAVLNIVNTISANLLVRTREFGMLRAVGMTAGQLRKMLRLEGAFYGVVSSVWGSIVGTILAFLIYKLIRIDGNDVVWAFPWKGIILASAVCTLIGMLATLIPLKRVSSLNIIESVKAVE